MGQNGRLMKILTGLLAVVIIGINLFFVAIYVQTLPHHWIIYLVIAIAIFLYLAFLSYLSIFCLAVMGVEWITRIPGVRPIIGTTSWVNLVQDTTDVDSCSEE